MFGSLGQHKDRISQFTVSKDIHKSAAIATLQTDDENKSRFPKSFTFTDFDVNQDNLSRGFVAFCSFFPCSLTFFHRGKKQKSGGRQQRSSRADKQHCFP